VHSGSALFASSPSSMSTRQEAYIVYAAASVPASDGSDTVVAELRQLPGRVLRATPSSVVLPYEHTSDGLPQPVHLPASPSEHKGQQYQIAADQQIHSVAMSASTITPLQQPPLPSMSSATELISASSHVLSIDDKPLAPGAAAIATIAAANGGTAHPAALSCDTRTESDNQSALLAWAQGNKNMSILAKSDTHNRWLVSFSLPVFFEMLLVHVLGPVSAPYVYCRWGKFPVINLALVNFNPLTPRGSVFNFLWVFFVAAWVLYFCYDTVNITLSELVMATLVVMSRNCIIAGKYAYASPGQLASLVKRRLTDEEISAWLLIAGWAAPSRHTLQNEIQYALKRTGVDVAHMRLEFQADDKCDAEQVAKQLRASFGELLTDEEQRPPGYRAEWEAEIDAGVVPGELLVYSLIMDSVRLTAPRLPTFFRMAWMSGLLHVLIPFIVRAIQGRPFFGTGVEVAISLGAALLVFPNVFASIMFVLVGVLDYRRRVHLMHQCSAMLSPQYRMFQAGGLLPLLNTDNPSTIAHWLDLRLVLKNWGEQFFQRIQIYASLWLFFLGGFVVYLFAQLIFSGPDNETQVTSVALVICDLVVVSVSLVLMLNAALTLNAQHVEHRRLLLRKLNTLQRTVSGCVAYDRAGQAFSPVPKQLRTLREAKDMLAVAIQVMEAEDELTPVKILGMRVNNNLLRAAIGVAGSAFIAGARLLVD